MGNNKVVYKSVNYQLYTIDDELYIQKNNQEPKRIACRVCSITETNINTFYIVYNEESRSYSYDDPCIIIDYLGNVIKTNTSQIHYYICDIINSLMKSKDFHSFYKNRPERLRYFKPDLYYHYYYDNIPISKLNNILIAEYNDLTSVYNTENNKFLVKWIVSSKVHQIDNMIAWFDRTRCSFIIYKDNSYEEFDLHYGYNYHVKRKGYKDCTIIAVYQWESWGTGYLFKITPDGKIKVLSLKSCNIELQRNNKILYSIYSDIDRSEVIANAYEEFIENNYDVLQEEFNKYNYVDDCGVKLDLTPEDYETALGKNLLHLFITINPTTLDIENIKFKCPTGNGSFIEIDYKNKTMKHRNENGATPWNKLPDNYKFPSLTRLKEILNYNLHN